jgi:hypothetical protein
VLTHPVAYNDIFEHAHIVLNFNAFPEVRSHLILPLLIGRP